MGYTPIEYHNQYPLYILSKGRADNHKTPGALENLGLKYYVAVEPQEVDLYKKTIGPNGTILELPFSNHGMGGGPARNWCWEHSILQGHKRHWIIDDNIMEFWRFHHNQRIRLDTGFFFRAMEDFCDRYENVMLAGPQYKFFVMDGYPYKPVLWNTRLMSCILIQNDCKHRWRGRYNEDVDLSLRVLKDGDCTAVFYTFLQGKMRTGTMKGGNTTEIYGDGTFEKSKMLANLHPDVVKLTKKYGRWHHEVDIRPFQKNLPILKPGIKIPDKPNEYGAKLVKDFGLPTQQLVDRPPPRKGLENL